MEYRQSAMREGIARAGCAERSMAVPLAAVHVTATGSQRQLPCTWPIDLLLYNRPVKRCHFVVDFAGSRLSWGENINQQLMLAS